jgi:hypothetical protein
MTPFRSELTRVPFGRISGSHEKNADHNPTPYRSPLRAGAMTAV